MYESYFGLSQRPFASVPSRQQYFPATAMEAARQILARCIQRKEGAGIVIGPSGSGKTLLCQMLAESFKSCLRVVLLSSGHLSTRRALLQAVLFGFEQPFRGMDEGELRLTLIDHLTGGKGCPQGALLLVDDAHALSLRLLDELRTIADLVTKSRPCVRIVLAGGPALEERLASPKLESFSQRIVARCYLEAYNRSETQDYLESQLELAGGAAGRIFATEVAQAVYQATDGVPRLINQLCDHALLLAYTGGRRQVQRADIEEAWADLQQLPTPWNAQNRSPESGPGVIEFGAILEDESAAACEPTRAASAAVPMLRVTGRADDLVPEPAEEVAEIQRALAKLDGEFQPAGMIGPEVELVLGDFADPFSEEFAEEEIVVDRYGNAAGSQSPLTFARQETPDEKQLDTASAFGIAGTAERQSSRTETYSTIEYGGELSEIADVPADRFSCPAASAVAQPDATVETGDWDAEPGTVRLRPQEPAAREEDEDPMIVVEDGYDDFDVEHVQPPTPVRRQEYRQLFAKLRRIC